jgi:hypothetical protein
MRPVTDEDGSGRADSVRACGAGYFDGNRLDDWS